MVRVISGVILGYLGFALPAYALFRMAHHDPHAPASIGFEIFSIVYGILFALVAGYLASFIAGRPNLVAAKIVAAIVALAAIASMIAKGVSWSPMAAVLFMAPAVLVGGWYYRRRCDAKAKHRR
jgi:hypothetical protein